MMQNKKIKSEFKKNSDKNGVNMFKQFLSLIIILAGALSSFYGVTVEQVIPHENKALALNSSSSTLTVGRDGLVYIANGNHDSLGGYMLKMNLDGSGKVGAPMSYAMSGIAVNQNSVVAISSAHFTRRVTLFDKNLREYGFVNEFLVSDAVGFDAPGAVAVGESGDFYAIDQHRNRVLRITPSNRVVGNYTMIAEGEEPYRTNGHKMFVSEKQETFYYRQSGQIRAVGFDGRTKYIYNAGIGGESWSGYNGDFFVDSDGVLYVIAANSNVVVGIDQNGNPFGNAILISDGLDDVSWVNSLAVYNNEIFVKRRNDKYLFERYTMDGSFINRASIDSETLRVSYDDDKWLKGRTIDFKIEFEPLVKQLFEAVRTSPKFHLWLRPFDNSNYMELSVVDGKTTIPETIPAGLYFWKVSPEVQPIQYGQKSQYMVYGIVEILPDGNANTINVVTTNNRTKYGRGETISGKIYINAVARPQSIVIQLEDGNGKIVTKTGALTFPTQPAENRELDFKIEASLTDFLKTGKYRINAVSNGYVSVPQDIYLGRGHSSYNQEYPRLVYGDYGSTFISSQDWWSSSDLVEGRLNLYEKLNVSFLTDRLGIGSGISLMSSWDSGSRQTLNNFAEYFRNSADGIAPENVGILTSALQTQAAYSAAGISQMSILTYMDAGLPIGGPGFDGRTVEQFLEDIERATKLLEPFGSFRGWIWGSNWWAFDRYYEHPEWRDVYQSARRNALENGAWDQQIDDMFVYWAALSYEADGMFTERLRTIDPAGKYITASAGPFRRTDAYPPISLANVDEVDLHIQWEQMGPPFNGMFNVDFYKRPGKKGWTHPEIWNDSGTGDQVLPTLFSQMMRGTNGIGQSGLAPQWGPVPEDSRLASQGLYSIHKAINNTAKMYGPWLNTLENNDQVAIIASRRAYAIDDYGHFAGEHFCRVFEAYVTLMHAHHPASIVFSEDMESQQALNKYAAILVVDQRVPMEERLNRALAEAKRNGVAIFYDNTCREEFVQGFIPIDVSFNKIEKNGHPAGNDATYWDFVEYVNENLPAVKAALDNVIPPVVDISNPEIFATETVNGDGRYIMLVNNTTPLLEPGQLWRTALVISSRLPVVTDLPIVGNVIYDVFAMKEVTPIDGKIKVDMRVLPSRIFAVLDKPIMSVSLKGPTARVESGSSVGVFVTVNDSDNRPINAAIPVKLILRDAENNIMDEFYGSSDIDSYSRIFNIPYNISGELTLCATELFSGKESSLTFNVGETAVSGFAPTLKAFIRADSNGVMSQSDIIPQEYYYGPHAKDIAIVDGDKNAIINMMNWDANLASVDIATGNLNWSKRVGHHFTFEPKAFNGDVFTVQGFDLESASGYHLYVGNSNGDFDRRFALYGVSRRTPQRFVPYLLNDNMNQFAIAPNGSWVAASGDLGVAVWSNDGTLRFSRDDWKDNRNYAQHQGKEGWWDARLYVPYIEAIDNNTLLIGDGVKITAVNAENGQTKWMNTLATEGQILKVKATDNGNVAIFTSSNGGRIFILDSFGKESICNAIPSAGDNFDITNDGNKIVIIENNVIKYYVPREGMIWSFSADSHLRIPKFSPDDNRIVVNSELGTLYVLSVSGDCLYEQNFESIPISSWLNNGNIFAATWMGRVMLINNNYDIVYDKYLDLNAPQLTSDNILEKNTLPTAIMNNWGNAVDVVPNQVNLLTDVMPKITFRENASSRIIDFQVDATKLYDGDLSAPDKPYLNWGNVAWYGEGSGENYLDIDFFNSAITLTGIALYEDESRPESWLRDVYLEVWNSETGVWDFVQPLLSDMPIHYHALSTPVTGGRFRIVMQPGIVSNIRLGELKLFGELIGGSHPDVLAKNDTAILFDEFVDNIRTAFDMNKAYFDYSDAASGAVSFGVNSDAELWPAWFPPYGHYVRDWNFEITEYPDPGQYRYLQFSWKADSVSTKGMGIIFGGQYIFLGERKDSALGRLVKIAGNIPTEWTTVTIDMFWLTGRESVIKDIRFITVGGGMKFDNLILKRTIEDDVSWTEFESIQ